MKRTINQILAQARKLVEPSPAEAKSFESIATHVLKAVRRAAKRTDLNLKITLGGSFAKGTWLKGAGDIDIFVEFPIDIDKNGLETLGVNIGKEALRGFNPRLRYSEHPYVEASVNGSRVNVVACYRVSKGRWKSSADRSPYHTKLVIREFDDSMRREARLLKRFMKTIGVYGAEVKIQGFSGYVCEVLILRYKTLSSVLRAASEFQNGQLVNGNDVSEGNKAPHESTLVILDPVDPRRNLGAAISTQNVSKSILAARAFMKHPNIEFFRNAKKKSDVTKSLAKHLVSVQFRHKERAVDILWGQLRRSVTHLQTQMRRVGFNVLRSTAASDEDENSAFIFLVEEQRLSNKTVRVGPTVFRKDDLESFLTKNVYGAELVWLGEDSKAHVLMNRGTTTVKKLLHSLLSSRLPTAGIAPGLAKEVSKSFKVLSGPATASLTRKHAWLKEGVNQLTSTDAVITSAR